MAAFPFFPQYDPDDCGVMALRMVCHYHGRAVSWQEIRQVCGVPYGDLSLLALSRGATRLGFEVLPLAMPLSSLLNPPGLPLIVHVHTGHFVVLYGVRGGDLLIADPARGRLRVPREHFAKEWLDSESLQALRLDPPKQGFPGSEGAGEERLEAREGFFANWRPAHGLRLLLEGITLWLLLSWAGTLFASVRPGQDALWLPLAISILLGFSWLALLVQWRRQRKAFLQDFLEAHTPEMPSFRRTPSAERAVALLFDIPWHARRAGIRFQGPRALFLTLLSLSFLAVYGPPLALVGLGALLLLGMCRAWNHQRLRFRRITAADRRRRFVQGQLLASAEDAEEPISKVLPGGRESQMPAGILLVLSLAIAVVVAWNAGMSPDGVLVLLPVLAGAILQFSRAGAARFAQTLADYRTLGPRIQDLSVREPWPGVSGELSYRSGSADGWQARIPPGASALLLLSRHGQGRPFLERLSAMTVDEGGVLSYHRQAIDKTNRHALQARMIAVWSNGEVSGLPAHSAGQDIDGQSLRSVREALLPGGSGREQGDGGTDLALETLVRAVAAEPEILLLEECTFGMEPFRELILLENLLVRRKGKTTLIATTREELIPSADLVLRPDGAPFYENPPPNA